MKIKKILNELKLKGIELKPDDKTLIELFVEVDVNDGDYVSKTYNFKLEEISDVIEIAKALSNLPRDFDEEAEESDLEVTLPSDEIIELYDYIPSDSEGNAHTITEVNIKVIIEGKIYTL